jgi:glycosyltransferase involved in cell wall biosynthesis
MVGPKSGPAEGRPQLRGTPWYRRHVPRVASELLEFSYSFIAFAKLWLAYHRYRPDLVYERYNLFLPSGLWLKRLVGIPLLVEVNAPLADERAATSGLALRALARWTEEIVWRGADVVLPVTEVLGRMVAAAGVPSERIVVVPNGVYRELLKEPMEIGAAKRLLGLEGRLILGFTGFVRPWHGLDLVLSLIAEMGDAANLHLLVVGDGPARPALEAKARELGVTSRVTYTGVVDRAAVAAYVAAFDIALQPDVTRYASPLKLFEYMAMARPIIAPAAANIREVLEDGVTALLFDPAQSGALATAIRRLVCDGDLRVALGAAARRSLIQRRMTWDDNASRVIALAEKLIARGTSFADRSASDLSRAKS